MRRYIGFLAIAILTLSGCETRTFYYVTSITRDLEYTVDQTGAFSESYMVDESEVNTDLDLPADAVVSDVYIESLSISTETLSGNEADGIILNGWIMTDDTTQFLNDLTMPVDPGVSDSQRLTKLVEEGVVKMRDSFEGFILYGEPSSIGIRLEGDSNPSAGERVHLRINIGVTVGVSYEIEGEVPGFLGGE